MAGKLKKTTKWGIAYFAIVVLFSLLYNASFFISPDSFILNSQLNLTPIQDVYEYLWEDNKSESKQFPIRGLDKLQLDLGKVFAKLDTIENEKNSIDEQRSSLENSIDSLYESNSETMWENAREYEQKQKESNVYILEKELSEEVNLLEKLAKENTWNTSYGLLIANKRVELANIRVKTANKDYQTSTYILENIGSFSDKDKLSNINTLKEDLKNISIRQNSYNEKVSKLKETMRSYLKDWSKERSNALKLVDFVYYSIGISTTTTFGEITANSRLIRGFVSLQLIISIFIMGGFVNSVLSGQNANKPFKL